MACWLAMVVPSLLRRRQREPRAVQRQREQAEAAGEGHAISQLQAYCRGCRPQRRRRRRQKQPRSLESSKARSPTTTTQQNQTSSQISTIVYLHTHWSRLQQNLVSPVKCASEEVSSLFATFHQKKICTKYLQFQTQKNRAYLCEESGVATSDLQRQKTQPLFLPPLQPVYWKPGMPTAGKLVIYVARGNVKSESRLSKMEYHFNLNIRSSGKSSASKSKVKPCTLFTLQKKKG